MRTVLQNSSPYGFWTVDQSRQFGLFPGSLLGLAAELPICLQRGVEAAWGETHIWKRHGSWVARHTVKVNDPYEKVAWLVWQKLQQSGSIWTADGNHKRKFLLPLSPAALMVLQYNPGTDAFMGVTSLVPNDGNVDGTNLGRYQGIRATAKHLPVFRAPT